MRILNIEDDKMLAFAIKTALEREGFAVDHVEDGMQGDRRIDLYHKEYDLIILDWMLPGKSGIDICKDARKKGITAKILMLTGRNELSDKVAGLDAGADDYITKPFAPEELIARVKTLLRRPDHEFQMTLQAGDIVLETGTRRVLRGGKEIRLSLKEFALLEYLMRNQDRALTREDIFSHIWDFASNSLSNVVDVHMYFLRKKLGEPKDGRGRFIETLPGVGYRLNSHVYA